MNNAQDNQTLPKYENNQNIELRPHTHLHEQAIKGHHQTNSTIAGPNGIQDGILNQGLTPADNSHLKQHNPNNQLENHTHQRIDTTTATDAVHPLQTIPNEPNSSSNEQQPNNNHHKKDAAAALGDARLTQEMKDENDNKSTKKPSISFDEPSTHASIVQNETPDHENNKANDGRYSRDIAATGNAGEATGAADNAMTEHKPSDDDKGDQMQNGQKHRPKPKNTGGDAHHIAEQESLGLGGLTGKQPVGEINFKKL